MPPPQQPQPPAEQFYDLAFPRAGIDLSKAFDDATPRPLPDQQEFARTCRTAVNVRSYETLTQRDRGGSRPGISKFIPSAVVSGWLIQDLATITITDSGAKA